MTKALAILGLVIAARLAAAQSQSASRYPIPPRSLGEADEIALALSAAPDEVSGKADVFVLRGSELVRARAGTNGCACMVGRDLHEGSLYPICFDQEGARTSLQREMMEVTLRAKGRTEDEVQRDVAAAYASGKLRMPAKPAMAYMMSPKQVLFSSPKAEGVRVGAWSPHLMLMTPGLTPEQLGLSETSAVDVIQIHREGDGHAELVVKVPKWSNGEPVAAPRKP
jgi:hypothetical protein